MRRAGVCLHKRGEVRLQLSRLLLRAVVPITKCEGKQAEYLDCLCAAHRVSREGADLSVHVHEVARLQQVVVAPFPECTGIGHEHHAGCLSPWYASAEGATAR